MTVSDILLLYSFFFLSWVLLASVANKPNIKSGSSLLSMMKSAPKPAVE